MKQPKFIAIAVVLILLIAGAAFYFSGVGRNFMGATHEGNYPSPEQVEKDLVAAEVKSEAEKDLSLRNKIISTCKLEPAKPEQLMRQTYRPRQENGVEFYSPENAEDLSDDQTREVGEPILYVTRLDNKIRWAYHSDDDQVDRFKGEIFCFDTEGRLRFHTLEIADFIGDEPLKLSYEVEYDEKGKFLPKTLKFANPSGKPDGFDPKAPPKPLFENARALEQVLRQ